MHGWSIELRNALSRRLLVALAASTVALGIVSSEATAAPPVAEGAADAAGVALRLIDESGRIHEVSPEKLAELPRTRVNVKVHDEPAEFEGVSLAEVLSIYGVEFGKALKGKRAPTVILAEATDGYRAVIALLEIDADTTDKKVLLVDRRDGKPLSAEEGPYRLVIPDEKQPIRWIRMLRTIRILNLQDVPIDALLSKQPGATAEITPDDPTVDPR